MENLPVPIAGSKLLTPAEAQAWAQKAPALLRQQIAELPDTPQQVSQRMGNFGTPYRVAGLTVGAILAAASLWVPGKWKWLTGAGAVGSGAFGLYIGNKADEISKTMQYGIPDMKKNFLKYADALETDPGLRQQFADYLANNVTAQDTASRPIESVVVGKAVLFGQTTPYLDIKSLAKDTVRTWRAAENSASPAR